VHETPELARVLLVDDHELLSGTVAIALRQCGIEVHIASGPSPAAIVDAARELAPALVLLDLDLGPALGSGLHLIGPLIETGSRVVMVTGSTDRAGLGACVEAGAAGVISKAAGFETLIDAVRRAAEGQPLLSDDERQAFLDELRRHERADSERLAPFAVLTPREQAVLGRLVAGESAETIAAKAYVSLATVRSHIRAILLKLGVNSQLAAVALVRDAGWVPPEE
jgi:DNA-binding NarL/FixJ family response regulator